MQCRPQLPRLPVLACGLALGLASGATGQVLVRDIHSGTSGGSASSSPAEFTAVGNLAFFTATDRAYGRELHVTDGTALGTRLVRDLEPGAGDAAPHELLALGGRVVFVATMTGSPNAAFASDGTREGTRLLRSGLVNSHDVTAAIGLAFFQGASTATGNELWVTDGTTAGTGLVADLNPGAGASALDLLGEANGALLFLRTAGDRELWRSDGTAAGTVRVATLSGTGAAALRTHARLGGDWLFALSHGSTNHVLWASDGSAAGTRMVAAVGTVVPQGMTAAGGRAYFAAGTAATGLELWTSDGTAAGTGPVADLRAGTAASTPSAFVAHLGLVWFSADDGVSGRELWRSDGTAAGTVRVFDTGPTGIELVPRPIHVHGNQLVFGAQGQLWTTDGSAAGTRALTGFNPPQTNLREFASLGGFLLYSASGGHGQEPWRSDLTAAGTILVKDVHAPNGDDSSPSEIHSLGARVVFAAQGDATAPRLWTSDGSTAGTIVQPGAPTGCSLLTRFGPHVYFRASAGTGLWRTDGNVTQELAPGGGFGSINAMAAGSGTLWFVASGAAGSELYATDGTAAGTRMVADIWPGGGGSSARDLTVVDQRVFFVATDPVHGSELRVSDGTAAGTQLVLDIVPGSSSSAPVGLTAFAGRVWFVVSDGTRGRELWCSDGTAAGTQCFDLVPGAGGSAPTELTVFGNQLCFAAQHASLGIELWLSDGTPAGTRVVADLFPGASGSNPTGLTVSGARLFFAASHPLAGIEPWSTDGTAAGTALCRDVLVGSGSARPREFAALPAGGVLFTANDGVTGFEAWRTDGTEGGTVRLTDLAPGALSADPGGFCVHGSQVFFAADDLVTGRELYVMPLDARGAASLERYGAGCTGQGGLVPVLDGNGVPALGNARFALLVGDARPQSAAALFFALDSANIPIGGGCALLILPPLAVVVSVPTSAAGTAELPLAIPDDVGMAGARLTVQAAVVDPAGAWQGLANFSNGVRLTLGR